MGALAPAYPEKIIAAGTGANTSAAFFGRSQAGKYYVYLETLGGGAGGRSYKDGTDGVQVHMTNTSNLPIEALETEYPLMIERYELVEDSGGAGKYRGGLGLRRDYRPLDHETTFSGQGERFVNQPGDFSAVSREGRGDLQLSVTTVRKDGWQINPAPCALAQTELSVLSPQAPVDLEIRRSDRRRICRLTAIVGRLAART